MDYDLYHEATCALVAEQISALNEARDGLLAGKPLSQLQWNGVEHTLQVLVENAIGKAKHLIKKGQHVAPVSAYDTFEMLARQGTIKNGDIDTWNKAIGLRNAIVHEYQEIDRERIKALCINQDYLFVTDFLCKPFDEF